MRDTIWNIANSNLVILLLGSGLGFLFVRLVWEPYKQRQDKNSRRRTMREEALFRLLSLERQIASGTFGPYLGIQLDGVGDFVRSLNPLYRTWSLDGLIFAGWGDHILNVCSPHIVRLKQAVEIGKDEVQGREQAQDAVAALKKILQT